jgi:hypothetical protein
MKILLPITIIGITLGLGISGTMPRLYAYKAVQGNVEVVAHVPTKTEIIAKAKYPEQIMVIWKLESNMGEDKNPQALHNLCKAQGKSNEFGYGGMEKKWCYDTFEQSVKVVDEWLDKEVMGSLCRYNTGTRTQSCWYSETAKALLN